MEYQLYINNQYVNSFATYSEACEARENLERRFKQAEVTILALY